MKKIESEIKFLLKNNRLIGKIIYIREMRMWGGAFGANIRNTSFWKQALKVHIEPLQYNKAKQIEKVIKKSRIVPVNSDRFFYSIDWFTVPVAKNIVLGNYTIDYSQVVESALKNKKEQLTNGITSYTRSQSIIIDALYAYYIRVCKCKERDKYSEAIMAIGSIFERPARNFFEGLQRILFINQFLWQSKHRLNGLGHLDWILNDLFESDIKHGKLDENQALELIKEFLRVLHFEYEKKSNSLIGDTGQILILGGLCSAGCYSSNKLTYLFIEASKQLVIPDPKILLRCSELMPDDLLEAALECVATGIGAPLLSNDDAVIPALKKLGVEEEDLYSYGTSACWEPLIPGESSANNNIGSLQYVIPLIDLMNSAEFASLSTFEELLRKYEEYFCNYVKGLLMPLCSMEFEEDPLLSLFSVSSLEKRKDITKGGAKYANLGITSVGLGTVVNSLLNIEKMVFIEKRFSLKEFNSIRRNDFHGYEKLCDELKSIYPCFGSDDEKSMNLVTWIMDMTRREFRKYKTKYGGVFKTGLSSPGYVSQAVNIESTFDGRKRGEPFNVHISAGIPLPLTELLQFAFRLDYSDLLCNGNVVDFFITPEILLGNIQKYMTLLKVAFHERVFQIQMNVVSSKVLIAAKENPQNFPNLVVRVWGFSAYFINLPDEYKDLLIQRAIRSEEGLAA